MVELRLDRGQLQPTANPRVFVGVVARVHVPDDALVYETGPEHRDLAELQRIVDQLPGLKVVTYEAPSATAPVGHPEDLVAKGAEYHQIGVVLGGRVVEGHAEADIYIHDRGALEQIEDGTRGLSLGYRCSLDQDRYQRGILLDHLSVVMRPRCGATCSLRADAAGGSTCACVASSVPTATTATSMKVGQLTASIKVVLDEESKRILDSLALFPAEDPPTTEETVKKILAVELPEHKADCTCKNHAIVHNIEESMSDADLKKLSDLQTQLDETNAKLVAANAEIATLKTDAAKVEGDHKLALDSAAAELRIETARADKLAEEVATAKADAQSKVDAAEAARTDADQKAFQAAVDARVELLADAVKVGVEDAATKTDREIKVAVVKKVDEMDIDEKASADYVNGMYAGALKRHARVTASLAEVRTTIVENRDAELPGEDPLKTEAKLREENEAKRANRWR